MAGFSLPQIEYPGKVPVESKLGLTINGLVVQDYVEKYSVEIQEEYDTENQFTAVDGTKYDMFLGTRRVLSVDFNPMTTEQINSLFGAIRGTNDAETGRPIQDISYIDPQNGDSSETFYCSNLPAATYFETKTEVYWQIPTVTFTALRLDESGKVGGVRYLYEVVLGHNTFSEKEIVSDINISMSLSSDGFSVGNIASSSISGSVYCKYDISPSYNSRVEIRAKAVTYNEDGMEIDVIPWTQLGTWFLKSFNINNSKVLSFTAMDLTSFLDNNYYVEYKKDKEGKVIPLKVNDHVAAIRTMINTLIGSPVNISHNCDDVVVDTQGTNSAKSFIEAVAQSSGINYRANLSSVDFESFEMGEYSYNAQLSEMEDFNVGFKGAEVDTVVLYCGATSELPNLIYPKMYKDYNIYIYGGSGYNGYPKANSTLEINAKFAPFTAANGGGRLSGLLGNSFGTEFSISKLKLNNLNLIGIGDKITLPGYSDEMTYATSISYSLTVNGIFANISGTTKSLSDNCYVGGMERDMMERLRINSIYTNIAVRKDGLNFAAPKPEEEEENGSGD